MISILTSITMMGGKMISILTSITMMGAKKPPTLANIEQVPIATPRYSVGNISAV